MLCSVYKTLLSKTFPQENSEAFLNLRKSALRKTKDLHQRVLTESFEKHFKKRHGFTWLLKKETFCYFPTSFEKAYGFHNKTPGKTVQRYSLSTGARVGPHWKKFYGAPFGGLCRIFWWGHQVIVIETVDVKKCGPRQAREVEGMTPNFTSPVEFNRQCRVTLNKSMTAYPELRRLQWTTDSIFAFEYISYGQSAASPLHSALL